jgi:hypothetical protein
MILLGPGPREVSARVRFQGLTVAVGVFNAI